MPLPLQPKRFEGPYVVCKTGLDEGPRVINIVEPAPQKASMELMWKKVIIGCKELKGDKFSAGDGVALTFKMEG